MGRAEQRRMDDIEKRLEGLRAEVNGLMEKIHKGMAQPGPAPSFDMTQLRAAAAEQARLDVACDLVSPAAFKAFGDAAQVARKGLVDETALKDAVVGAHDEAFNDELRVELHRHGWIPGRKGTVEVDQETKKHERGPVPPGVPTPKKASDR